MLVSNEVVLLISELFLLFLMLGFATESDTLHSRTRTNNKKSQEVTLTRASTARARTW